MRTLFFAPSFVEAVMATAAIALHVGIGVTFFRGEVSPFLGTYGYSTLNPVMISLCVVGGSILLMGLMALVLALVFGKIFRDFDNEDMVRLIALLLFTVGGIFQPDAFHVAMNLYLRIAS